MHQIYITAAITTVLSFLLYGGFLKWKSPKEERTLLLSLILIELPMAFAFFYLVRLPLLDGFVQLFLTKGSPVYRFITIFYAPLTEEPAKLLPVLIPFFWRKINSTNALRAAFALGLGFGLGEIWLIASFVASAPAYANLSWYEFTGFINERFMVCAIHGVFTATALRKLHKGFIWGILGAMGLHYLGNLPIYLSGIDFLNLGKDTWSIILTIYVPLYFILMMLLFSYYATGKASAIKYFFGNSVCPECGHEYTASIIGLNFFNKRYEKCPNCHKWHWVKLWREPEKLK